MLIKSAAGRTEDFVPILRAIAAPSGALVKVVLNGGDVHRAGCEAEGPENRDGPGSGEGWQDVRTAIEGAQNAAG